jgi:hypothetical protein
MSKPKHKRGHPTCFCTCTINEDTATCLVRSTIDDEEFIGQGSAVRAPEDKPNLHIAELLAVGRAYQSIGRRMERQAEGLVKHKDDVRERRQAARVERAAETALERSAQMAHEDELIDRTTGVEDPYERAMNKIDSKPGLVPGTFTFKNVTQWFR